MVGPGFDGFAADIERLRLQIMQAMAGDGCRSVSVVGLTRKSGVSTLCIALADSISRLEQPVTLVDGHAGAPRLHRLLGRRGSGCTGVADLLAGTVQLVDAMHAVNGDLLMLMPIGRSVSEPVFCSRARWRKLLGKHSRDDRITLIDGGRLNSPVSHVLASVADATVLVVQAGQSPWESVAYAIERLAGQGARVLGVTLSKRRFPIPGFLYRRL